MVEMDCKKKIEELLLLAVEKNASDIHLKADRCPVFRIFRKLTFLEDHGVLSYEDVRSIAFVIMTAEQQEKFLEKKEIDFSYAFKKSFPFQYT